MSEMSGRNAFSLFYLVVCLAACSSALEYLRTRAGLRSIPDDIPLNVNKIDLRYNELVEVTEQGFSKFSILTSLQLSRNKISYISPQGFTNTQIKWLNLWGNELTAVPDLCALSDSLRDLDLSSNKIQTMNPQHINCLTHINYLDLRNNQISVIPAQTFTNIHIKRLDLSGNELTDVPDLCVLSDSLKQLYLGDNKIQTVDPKYINCLTNIRDLYLYNNPFTRLPEDTFTGLEQLNRLQLSYTGISSPAVLTNIHLSYLYIHDTSITTFPDPVLSNSQIDHIRITNINLVCNCSIAWMLFYNMRGWPSGVYIGYRPCKSPAAFTEVAWRELTITDLCPGDIRLWEITYQEGPSVTIRFQTQDSTATSSVDHYVLQYSKVNVTKVDWMNGTTVPSTGKCVDFSAVTQDGLDPGTLYIMRVIPVISGSIGDYEKQACPQSEVCRFLQSEDIIMVCACTERHSNETCYLERHESCFYNEKVFTSSTPEEPHVQMVCPSYGPLSGQTDVSMWGRQLDLSGINITLGHVPCLVLFSNATYLQCVTSNGTGLVSEGQPQDMIIGFEQPGGSKRVSIEEVFTFRGDPVITSIYPLESFTKGGINITVSGSNLDSVARALMEIRLIYIKLQEQDIFASVCITLNSTRVTCKSPEVILRKGFSTQDLLHELNRNNGSHVDMSTEQNAQIPVNQDDLKVFISVKMDAVHKSHGFMVYSPPIIHSFPEENSVRLFMPKWPSYDNHLSIKGKRLDYGCQVDDYIVLVGDQTCSVTDLFTDTLTCIPPLTHPVATGDTYGGNPAVKVFVGNIQASPGFLHYGSVWDHKTFLIAFSVGMGVVVPLIAGIVICLICRRFCRNKDSSAASPPVTNECVYDNDGYLRAQD